MGDAVSHLATGDCGVRWTAPTGTIVQHSEHELIVRDEHKLIWHVMISPRPFAAGGDEDAALVEDMAASARSAFDTNWHAQHDRTPGDRPRTDDRAWSPLIEAASLSLGAGRCARVIRRLTYERGNEMIAGHVIVPVAMGTVELRVVAKAAVTGLRESVVTAGEPGLVQQPQAFYDRPELDATFPDHPLSLVRAALDRTLGELVVTRPSVRQRFVALPEAGCTFVPPPRFMPVAVKMAPGLQMLWRGGLDGWKRLLDVWRIGTTKSRGADPRPALIESADRIVRGWEHEGASDIELDTRAIGDLRGAPQIEQYVRFRGGGIPTHTLHRWWVDAEDVIYRIGSNGPPELDRALLAADLDAVQSTWRTL